MADAQSTQPTEFYQREQEIPMGVPVLTGGYSLITPQGARQRQWGGPSKVDPAQLRREVLTLLARDGEATVQKVREAVAEKYGEIPTADVQEAMLDLARNSQIYAMEGDPVAASTPVLISGSGANVYTPQAGHRLITPSYAAQKGWIPASVQSLQLTGPTALGRLLPLLKRLGGLYARGASSTVESLDLVDLEIPGGGRLRISLNEATPEAMKNLGELFEVLDRVIQPGNRTEAFLNIREPDEACPLIQALKQDPAKE